MNKPNRPIEDNIRGAFQILEYAISEAAGGYNYGYVYFEGYWVISAITLLSASPEYEHGEIGLKPVANQEYLTLVDGSFGYQRDLNWSGRLLLQGEWVVRGRRYAVTDTTSSCRLRVMCERVSEAQP